MSFFGAQFICYGVKMLVWWGFLGGFLKFGVLVSLEFCEIMKICIFRCKNLKICVFFFFLVQFFLDFCVISKFLKSFVAKYAKNYVFYKNFVKNATDTQIPFKNYDPN
jgi:hypothetical protein